MPSRARPSLIWRPVRADAVIGLPAVGPAPTRYDPGWASVSPTETLSYDYDSSLSSAANGDALRQAIQALAPGQRLEVGGGTYSMQSRFDISLVGLPTAPIWIDAKAGATPVITRPNAAQNAMNIGSNGRARYLAIRGFEVTGGSAGIRSTTPAICGSTAATSTTPATPGSRRTPSTRSGCT